MQSTGPRIADRRGSAVVRLVRPAAPVGGAHRRLLEQGGRPRDDAEFIVLHARGGGYLEGTPREGWDHAEPWLPHAVSLTALEPRFITAELILSETVPAGFELKGLAAESLARAAAEIDGLWAEVAA